MTLTKPMDAASRSRPSPIWLLLAVAGALLPWTFNLRYFAHGGSVLPQVFFRDAGANALTTAITIDVYLAAVSFAVWVCTERRVRRPWAWVLGCLGIGLACVLPLYLWQRQRSAAQPLSAVPTSRAAAPSARAAPAGPGREAE